MGALNRYRHRKIGDKNLITTDHGTWMMLDDEGYAKLKSGDIDKNLSNRLEDAGIIITPKNKRRIKEVYWKRYGFLKDGPSLHIVVVTLRCDQKCLYCHASSKGPRQKKFDMTKETATRTVNLIFQSPADKVIIEFQGGEPLLNLPVIEHITKYARKRSKETGKKVELVMVTNLQAMTEKTLDYCLSNDIHLCTSLDGPKQLHDMNRPIKSHAKTIHWIKRITEELDKRKIDDTQMNALVTITKESLKYPEEIVDEYRKAGLNGLHLRYMNKLGYAINNNEIDYEPSEFISFWKKAMDHILKINEKEMFKERGAMIILRKILTGTDPNFLDMRSPCGAVMGQLAYNYDGQIYCCDEARTLQEDLFKVGDVDSGDLSKICKSEDAAAIISESINDTTVCDCCAFKPYCGLCPVCTYAEQGTTSGNISKTSRCKIFMAQFDYLFDKYSSDSKAKKIFDSWITKQ